MALLRAERFAIALVTRHDNMLQAGLTPAAALRQAQLQMLKQKRWKAPYYWAAFTLHGEWK